MPAQGERPQTREVDHRCHQDDAGTSERTPYSSDATDHPENTESHRRHQDIRPDPQGTNETGAKQRAAHEPWCKHGDVVRQPVVTSHDTRCNETDQGDIAKQHDRYARVRCHEEVKNHGQQARSNAKRE